MKAGQVVSGILAAIALASGCGGVPPHRVFAGSGSSDYVLVIDAKTGSITDSVAVMGRPVCMIAGPRNDLYVSAGRGLARVTCDSLRLAAYVHLPDTAVDLALVRDDREVVASLANGSLVGFTSDLSKRLWVERPETTVSYVCASDSGALFASNGAIEYKDRTMAIEGRASDVEWYSEERAAVVVCSDSLLLAVKPSKAITARRVVLPGAGRAVVSTPARRTFVAAGENAQGVWVAAYAAWRGRLGAHSVVSGSRLTGLAVSPTGDVVYVATDDGLHALEASWMKEIGGVVREGGFVGVACLP